MALKKISYRWVRAVNYKKKSIPPKKGTQKTSHIYVCRDLIHWRPTRDSTQPVNYGPTTLLIQYGAEVGMLLLVCRCKNVLCWGA